PFSKMRLGEGEAVRGGTPFEIADLQAIFRAPVFTAEERPKGGRGEAAFWLPLLALFAGVRLAEAASLRAADVAYNRLIGAVSMHIKSDRKVGKTLKTQASERFVPVHQQLVALGFLDYVAAQSKTHGNNTWLFPKVAPGTTGAAAFSKWFGRYI